MCLSANHHCLCELVEITKLSLKRDDVSGNKRYPFYRVPLNATSIDTSTSFSEKKKAGQVDSDSITKIRNYRSRLDNPYVKL